MVIVMFVTMFSISLVITHFLFVVSFSLFLLGILIEFLILLIYLFFIFFFKLQSDLLFYFLFFPLFRSSRFPLYLIYFPFELDWCLSLSTLGVLGLHVSFWLVFERFRFFLMQSVLFVVGFVLYFDDFPVSLLLF